MPDGKIVFLTGGTGSFGVAFICRLLADSDISMIRVFSRDEHKQSGLRKSFRNDRVSFYIGDIRDKERLKRAMEGSNWVVHAAALKQAPIGEIEPFEFIKTNVYGSENVINAALDCDIEKALLISSDKAVEPINLYGATKMCAEKMFLQADRMRSPRRTRFACTRYGNVAGTAGSIVPLLLSLGPKESSTIYDERATRFWIGIREANEFVLDSLKQMKGGEVFIPKMKSVRIKDVVAAVRPNYPVKVVGPRDGDKVHEVLFIDPVSGIRLTSNDNEFMTVEEIRDAVFGTDPIMVKH